MAEHEAHVTQIAAEKAMRTARLAIPNFHLAHPPVSRCEHVVVKFWGNKYCRGLRCVGCKMELTRSHEQMVRVIFFFSLFFGVFCFFRSFYRPVDCWVGMMPVVSILCYCYVVLDSTATLSAWHCFSLKFIHMSQYFE